MTLLAVPIFVAHPSEVAESLDLGRTAVAAGARLIEWRVDELASEDGGTAAALELARASPAPCIVTCRPAWEGGRYEGDEAARRALLVEVAAAHHPPRYVDVELAAWRGDARLRGDLGAALRRSDPAAPAPALILSSHDFTGRPADLLQRVEAMTADVEAAVVKLAWTARSLRDNLEAFDLLAERRKPMIALCMGPFGAPSRVLAPKFGGLLSFASLDADSASAPGQPDVRTLHDLYRFDGIERGTRVYGVVGWPVAHSRSPAVHNAAFAEIGWDGVYLPLPVPPEYEHFKATIGALVDHPRLNFAGASVTIPHKENLRRFVEERGGRLDAMTTRAGAANTLVVGATGALACANTDLPAVIDVLTGVGLRDGRGLVLGAGGVARAVVAALTGMGAAVVVVARTPARARALADAFDGATASAPEGVAGARFDVVVNATPVGMTGGPDPAGSPLPAGVTLDDDVTVFDTVYDPVRTPLLREAEARGARTVTGLEMFVRQAARQFTAWTGVEAPIEVFRGRHEGT